MFILKWFCEWDSEVILGITSILIGLLIPIAIFMVEDSKEASFPFDRSIIFSKVINVKELGIAILLFCLSPLFKNGVGSFLFLIAIFLYIKVMSPCLKWINVIGNVNDNLENDGNHKSKLRLEFLNELENYQDALFIWNYIWDNPKARKYFEGGNLIEKFIIFYNKHYSSIYKTSDGTPKDKNLHKILEKNEELIRLLKKVIKDPQFFEILFRKLVNNMDSWENRIAEREMLKECLIHFKNNKNKMTSSSRLSLFGLLTSINKCNNDKKYLLFGRFEDELKNIDLENELNLLKGEYREALKKLNPEFLKEGIVPLQTDKEYFKKGKVSGLDIQISEFIKSDSFLD